VLGRLETINGKETRRFYPLKLERDKVAFLSLHWVIVHPIDERSPLFGVTQEEFEKSDAEFLVLLTAVDETFSQTVHTRTSYKHHEVIWNARFGDMFAEAEDGLMTIDLRRIDEVEAA
jgi:inward rectifier potassium channel